jgi:hypothetical protein
MTGISRLAQQLLVSQEGLHEVSYTTTGEEFIMKIEILSKDKISYNCTSANGPA